MSTESDAQELAAFGQAVRELREQRGMSVDDLSSASQLPRERKCPRGVSAESKPGKLTPTTTR
jgi:ribosome-binding protein aMBF1 (putative translation factor)